MVIGLRLIKYMLNMYKVTDVNSGFSTHDVRRLVEELEHIYQSDLPPADVVEVVADETWYSDKTKMCYASVRTTWKMPKTNKIHTSRSRFKMQDKVINRKTFMYL